MVPLGRGLQRLANELIVRSGIGEDVAIGACVLLALPPVAAYYSALNRACSARYAAGHFMLVTLIAAPLASMILVPIELCHLLIFGALGALLRLSLSDTGRQGDLEAVGLGLAVALTDELLQGLHPERVFDLRDLAFDLGGVVLGLLFVKPLVKLVLWSATNSAESS